MDNGDVKQRIEEITKRVERITAFLDERDGDSGEEDLKKRVEELEQEVEELKGEDDLVRGSEYVPSEKKDTIIELIGDNVADTVWDNYWYEFVYFFDSGQVSISSATGSPTIDNSNGINFITGSSTNDHQSVAVTQQPVSNLFSVRRPTLFRTTVAFGNLASSYTLENSTSYISTLHSGTATAPGSLSVNRGGVGFKQIGTSLYGVSYSNQRESQTYLRELEEDDATGTRKFYQLELRYYPSDRVDYYVDGKYYASVSDNLPADEATTSDNQSRFFSLIYTREAAQKSMKIYNYELIHSKK